MLIRVMYADNRYDMINARQLEYLIRSRTITRFQRNGVWVVLGQDPVREWDSPARVYTGPDRRRILQMVPS
jgi:hypothetical protein